MTKTESIQKYLNGLAAKGLAEKDLAAMYDPGMEVQVMVAQGDGERVDTGGRGDVYSDGVDTWRAFRIPAQANTDPVDNDGPLRFSLDQHCAGIGMTGWNWKEKRSVFFGYDFDAIIGHSERHAKKLTEAELLRVQDSVSALPWVTVRKSTSGKGLHLYVRLGGDGIRTETHTEHAALARAILGYMSGQIGVDLMQSVDACGMVLWQWHRKQKGTDGLRLVRQGEPLDPKRVPANWKDHAPVVTRRASRVAPGFEGPDAEAAAARADRVSLDDSHRRLMDWMFQNQRAGYWCNDLGFLICHVCDLADAAQDPTLGLRGKFTTTSAGTDRHTPNCYAIPLRDGGWVVRRYGNGVEEDKLWVKDTKGVVRAYFNRPLTLGDAARLGDGEQTTDGGFYFQEAGKAVAAMGEVGIKVTIPDDLGRRDCKVVEKNGKLVVSVKSVKEDKPIDGFVMERGWYRKVMNPPDAPDDELDSGLDFDDCIRHITSDTGADLGWVVRSNGGTWREEPLANVKMFLVSEGVAKADVDLILGRAVTRAWKVVNKPFQPEYGLDREWNRSTAGFAVAPTLAGEVLDHQTWDKVLDHAGAGLNEAVKEHPWCRRVGVTTGAHYLKLWLACLVRHPKEPLPFLAFVGEQDSGKSTFHEAFAQLILRGGVMDGALALTSQGNFNGELQDAILCYLEEVNLRTPQVYQKVKDMVTSPFLTLHVKGRTPAKVANYVHFVQCVNDPSFIPIFQGDTRITAIRVPNLTAEQKIPKRDLIGKLEREASDFLASLIAVEIPDSKDRLMLPVITTREKEEAEFESMDPVQKFAHECLFPVQGQVVSVANAHAKFLQTYGDDLRHEWGPTKFAKALPGVYPQGRWSKSGGGSKHLGNCAFDPEAVPQPLLKLKDKYLVPASSPDQPTTGE